MPKNSLQNSFAITKVFTPIFNSPNLSAIFGGMIKNSLPLDEQGLLRSIEMIAFPKTKLKILEELKDNVVRIKTSIYPGNELFVHTYFLKKAAVSTPLRKAFLLGVTQIINTLDFLVHSRYQWGGNCLGIPELLDLYPPQNLSSLDEEIKNTWMCKGFDCSGLLYYATDGFTPRNTTQLIQFGKPLHISGLKPCEIAKKTKPLDLIVWKGHVLIVYNENLSIESLLGKGVIKYPLEERLSELIEKDQRIPLDKWESLSEGKKGFVIRRWHPEILPML